MMGGECRGGTKRSDLFKQGPRGREGCSGHHFTERAISIPGARATMLRRDYSLLHKLRWAGIEIMAHFPSGN